MKKDWRSWRALMLAALLSLSATTASATPAPLRWRWLSPQPAGDQYSAICMGRGRIVGIGNNGMVGLSQDGRGWEPIWTGSSTRLIAVNCDGPKYLATGITADSTFILSSLDGRNWQEAPLPGGVGFREIAWGNGRWLVLMTDGRILSSTDGLTWKTLVTGLPASVTRIKFGGGRFIVVANERLYSSTDGSRWSIASPTGVTDLVWGKGRWLATAAISAGGTMFTNLVTSTDGLTWRAARTVDLRITMGGGIKSERFDTVYYGADGLFYAIGIFESWLGSSPTNGAHAISSYDLVTWGGASTAWYEPYGQFLDLGDIYLKDNPREALELTQKQSERWVNVQESSLSLYSSIKSVSYGDGRWVALSDRQEALISEDGERWRPESLGWSISQLRWQNGRWVGVSGGKLLASNDLKSWAVAPTAFPEGAKLTTGNGQFLFAGEDGQLYGSTDGLNWAPLGPLPTDANDWSLIWTGDRLLVATTAGAYSSPDGATWAPLALPNGLKPTQFAAGGGRMVAMAWTEAAVSTDGQDWAPVSLPTRLYDPLWVGDRFIARQGLSDLLAESADGMTWQVRGVTTQPISSISWAGERLFLGISGGGLVTTQTGAPCGAWWSDLSPQFGSCAAVNHLYEQGIVVGTPEGAYLPNAPLNRASFAKMITLALGEAPDPDGNLPYTDTKGHWGAELGYLQTATRLGLIVGMPDGRFDPDGLLTRAAALKIVTAAAGFSPSPEDLSPSQPWYSTWYSNAYYHQLLTPLVRLYGWELDPSLDRPATRGEAAILIDHFLRR